MEIGQRTVRQRAILVHGHPLPIEVVVAGNIAAGHFEERADVVGADAVARLLDARAIRVIEIIFGGQATTANLFQPVLFIPGQGLLTAQPFVANGHVAVSHPMRTRLEQA